MLITTQRKQLLSFASLFIFLSSQILPAFAQTLPAAPSHIPTITPPIIIGHHHIGIPILPQPSGTPTPAVHQHCCHTTDNFASSTAYSSSHHQQLADHTHDRGIFTSNYWSGNNSGNINSNHNFIHHWNDNSAVNTANGTHHFFHHWHRLDNYTPNALLSDHNQYVHHGTQLWANLGLNGTKTASSINLDLSSTNAAMSAGHMLHGQTINITVGGTQLSVTADTKLTPAEYLAVKQIEFTGQQTLVLDAQGSAAGGTVVIGQHLSQLISNLVIPQGVTVIDLTKSGTLNLSGNITDNGSLYIGSRNPLLNGVTIDANNINVQGQGTLSDIIPAGTLVWFNGHTILDSNLNFNLDAVNNITNSGTIFSGGTMSLTAGGSITNALPAGVTGIAPTIQATNNVNLVAGTGNIINSGLIQSTQNNINISSSIASNDININGNGTLQALNGNINFRDASYTGTANINMLGGNYLSQQLNLYSGIGSITGQIHDITAEVNASAGSMHFSANTANLILGNNYISGDPTYANTGDITISGNLSPSEALAIIAGGNIIGDGTSSISSSSAVTLVAGADITSGGGTGGQTVTNATGGVGAPVTFTFNNTAGGNIDFTQSGTTPVIASGGGNITLIANSNSSTTGNIWFPTATSVISNNTSGNAGNILIVAGGQGGTAISGPISAAIQTGVIQAASTNAGSSGGSITIYTAAPVITGGSATYNTTGSLTSGSYPTSAGSYTFNNSTISINGSITTVGAAGTNGGSGVAGGPAGNGGNVTIQGGTLSMASSTITTTGGTGGTGGGNAGGVGGAGGTSGNSGNVSLTATSDITFNSIAAAGPIGGAAGASATGAGSSGGTGGNGGTVNITSSGGAVTSAGSILATGGNGGFTRNGGTGGNGGAGASGGAAGSITIFAATSVTVTNGNVNTTGGTASGGGNAGVGGSLGGSGKDGKVGGNLSITAGTSISINGFVQSNGGTGSSGGTTTGYSTTIVGGNGAMAGTILLSAGTGGVSVSNNINAVGAGGGVGRAGSLGGSGGAGNNITVTTTGAALLNNISSSGGSGSAGGSSGSGNANNGGNGGSAGNITISAGDVVTIATTNSNGGNSGFGGTSTPGSGGAGGTGGNGGAISISTSSSITLASGNINATGGNGGGGGNGGTTGGNGGNGGNAGSMTFTASRLQLLTDLNANGGTGNTGGTGTPSGSNGINGVGGTISLTNSNTGTFTIGAATGTNYVGQLHVDGRNGGTITLKNGGAVDIVAGNGIISAMNTVTGGNGGNIQFANTTTGGPITITNDGTIENAQLGATTGIVGFNGGTSGTITITGAGTITAGQFVNVGNLDPNTLAIQSPFTVVSPFTGTFTNQSGSISITQASISGTLQVSDTNSGSGSSSSTTVSTNAQSPAQILFFQIRFQQLIKSLQDAANTKLFEQIGTRIATDYTPWTTYNRQPLLYSQPLQSGVSFNRISQVNSALFAASEFNANELTALSQAGVVFGSKSGNAFFDLVKGYVLFVPSRDIQVQTREGIAYIPKGAAAWIMETGNDVAIFDLHDTLWGGVIKVVVNNKPLTLGPGKELLLTKNTTEDFSVLNPSNALGYRNVNSSDLGSGIKAYVCDFSIAHGVTNVPVIHSLLMSNNRSQRKAARNMLKNEAILADLTGYPEYQH